MREELDELDFKLLELLQEDGRITNADLARRIGLSPPSVLQRVRKLEELGYIREYAAILNESKLGLPLCVWVQISLALHQDRPIEAFRKSIQAIPEVMECYHVSGEFDFLLKIQVADMASYEKLIREKLSKIRGLGKINSCFVMAATKRSLKLPLAQ